MRLAIREWFRIPGQAWEWKMTDDPGATHFYGDGCDEAHGSWANMEAAYNAERALVDDLAAKLATLIDAVEDLLKHTDDIEIHVQLDVVEEASDALARWREARQR